VNLIWKENLDMLSNGTMMKKELSKIIINKKKTKVTFFMLRVGVIDDKRVGQKVKNTKQRPAT
jgi:hypothetical protein